MRKDQPKLKKQFDRLEAEIKLLKRKLKHRERVIAFLSEKLKAAEHHWTEEQDYINNPMPF